MIISRTLPLLAVLALALGACTTVTQQAQPQTPPPAAAVAQAPTQPSSGGQQFASAPPQQTVVVHQPSPPPPVVIRPSPIKMTATGHGSLGSYGQHNAGQQRLMAMRAAKLDAFRNLAEQVYGFKISGSTTLNAFATQNDTIRSHVDAFMRGAKIVDMTLTQDGIYEATVELDLPPDFRDCIVRGTCFPQNDSVATGCAGAGCAPMSLVCTGSGCSQSGGRSWWDNLWQGGN